MMDIIHIGTHKRNTCIHIPVMEKNFFLQNGAFQFGNYHFEISSTGRTDNKVVVRKRSVRDVDLSDMLGRSERTIPSLSLLCFLPHLYNDIYIRGEF